jgi:hypothetical protein
MKPIFTSPVNVGDGEGLTFAASEAFEADESEPFEPPLEQAARTAVVATAAVKSVMRRRVVIFMTGSITRSYTLFNI